MQRGIQRRCACIGTLLDIQMKKIHSSSRPRISRSSSHAERGFGWTDSTTEEPFHQRQSLDKGRPAFYYRTKLYRHQRPASAPPIRGCLERYLHSTFSGERHRRLCAGSRERYPGAACTCGGGKAERAEEKKKKTLSRRAPQVSQDSYKKKQI